MMDPRLTSLIRISLLVLLLAAVGAGSVAAQDDISDDQVNEIAKEIYCPVCESTPLDVCPTKACADWREVIRTQLSDGASRQEVMDYFARQYGDGVLANPPREGISLVILWILPILGVLLGILLLARYMRGLRGEQPAPAPAAAMPGPSPTKTASPTTPTAVSSATELEDYMARVEEEMEK